MYLITAILMISFGLIFIAAFLQPVFSKTFGERFEVVKGEVVKSTMKQGLLEQTEAGLMNYSYDIEYAYQFDGKLRKSSNVYKYLEQSSSEKIFVTQVLNKYPLGAIIDVYVCSRGGSYLELSPQKAPYFVLFLGAISLFFGIGMLVFLS